MVHGGAVLAFGRRFGRRGGWARAYVGASSGSCGPGGQPSRGAGNSAVPGGSSCGILARCREAEMAAGAMVRITARAMAGRYTREVPGGGSGGGVRRRRRAAELRGSPGGLWVRAALGGRCWGGGALSRGRALRGALRVGPLERRSTVGIMSLVVAGG